MVIRPEVIIEMYKLIFHIGETHQKCTIYFQICLSNKFILNVITSQTQIVFILFVWIPQPIFCEMWAKKTSTKFDFI